MTVTSYDNAGLNVTTMEPVKSFGKYTAISTDTSGAAWFRVANIQSRVGMQIHVSTTGGSYSPGFTKFVVLRSWDTTSFYVTDIVKTGTQYTTHCRMSSSNGGGAFNLDIYFNAVAGSQHNGFAEITVIPHLWGATPDSNNAVYSTPTRNPTVETNSNTVTL